MQTRKCVGLNKNYILEGLLANNLMFVLPFLSIIAV